MNRRIIAVGVTTALALAVTGSGAVAANKAATTAIGCAAPPISSQPAPTRVALTRLDRLFRLADGALATAVVPHADVAAVCASQSKVAAAIVRMPRAGTFDVLNDDFNAAVNELGAWYTSLKQLLTVPAAPRTGTPTGAVCVENVCSPSITDIGSVPDVTQLPAQIVGMTQPINDATRGILITVGTLAHLNFNLPVHVAAIMPASLPVDEPMLAQSERGPGPADDTQIMANAADSLSSIGTASLARGKNTCDNFPFDVGSIDNNGRPGPHDTQGDSENSTVHGYANGGAYVLHDYTESGDGASIGGNTDSQDADAQIGFAATFIGGVPNELADVQVTMPMYWAGDAHAGSNTPLGTGFVPYLGKLLGSFAGKSTSTVKVNITADMYNDGVTLTSYPVFDPPELVGDNGTGGNSAGYYGSYTYKANIPFSGTPHTFGSVLHYHAHLTDSPSTATDVLADADFAPRDILGQVNTAMIRWHFIFNPGWPNAWVECNS